MFLYTETQAIIINYQQSMLTMFVGTFKLFFRRGNVHKKWGAFFYDYTPLRNIEIDKSDKLQCIKIIIGWPFLHLFFITKCIEQFYYNVEYTDPCSMTN